MMPDKLKTLLAATLIVSASVSIFKIKLSALQKAPGENYFITSDTSGTYKLDSLSRWFDPISSSLGLLVFENDAQNVLINALYSTVDSMAPAVHVLTDSVSLISSRSIANENAIAALGSGGGGLSYVSVFGTYNAGAVRRESHISHTGGDLRVRVEDQGTIRHCPIFDKGDPWAEGDMVQLIYEGTGTHNVLICFTGGVAASNLRHMDGSSTGAAAPPLGLLSGQPAMCFAQLTKVAHATVSFIYTGGLFRQVEVAL